MLCPTPLVNLCAIHVLFSVPPHFHMRSSTASTTSRSSSLYSAMIAFSSQEGNDSMCYNINIRSELNRVRVVPLASNPSNKILGSSKRASSLWRLGLRKSLCQHAKQLRLRIRDLTFTFRFFSHPLTTFLPEKIQEHTKVANGKYTESYTQTGQCTSGMLDVGPNSNQIFP